MSIIPSIVKWLNVKRLSQIELFRNHPVETQEEVLYKLLARAALTEWGRKYNYSTISTIQEFQSRLPIQEYEDIVPYVERLRKGESNLLWPGEIKWFAKSSGTTSSKSKFIPMSREALEECHYRAGKDIIAIYTMNYPQTRIFSGKGLTLGGSHRINQFSNDSLYGDLSAILIENAPFWVEIIRTPKPKIALIEDFEEKLHKITQATINENVTSLAGVPSWNLVLIKHILEYTGKSNLLDVWPNLEVFFHGGISFVPYREQFRNVIKSSQMHYMETYNASEGFFGIQDDPSREDMLLMLDYGIFYEFIPVASTGSATGTGLATGKAVTIGDVQEGVNYAIVVSTNGGLWRYMIGDTIRFTSTNPYRFRITGRTRHYINAFGEEVIVDNADKALSEACAATNAVVSDYTAGPIYMGSKSRGSHEWLIEFEKEPSNIEKFTRVLDDTLKAVNTDYEAKRFKDISITKPIVRSVPAGTFKSWLRNKNKLGGQNKVPRLSNTREYIEELYAIAGIKSSLPQS
jgi:hypothetical protein